MLGATGIAGSAISKKLLSDTAYQITLFARHAGEHYSEDSRTAVINGDAENMEDLTKAVQGQDVVYCAISGDALPKIAGNIVAAMSESSVKRLIFMGAVGIYNEIPDEIDGEDNLNHEPAQIPNRQAVDIIEASSLNYTVLRPGYLREGAEDDFVLSVKGEPAKGYVTTIPSLVKLTLQLMERIRCTPGRVSVSHGMRYRKRSEGVFAMEYTTLGNTDIQISKLCVGCMSFGKAGTMHDWTLDETETEKVVKHALSLGINFFDTANGYSAGTSEEYLGRALKKNIARDKVVIASKVYFNPGRLSAGAIHREIDGTLKRLGTDYLDLYIIHRFDYDTPIEETMEALNDLVKAGKVRALGASAMYGYQFYNMQLAARDHGWAQFQAMENHYNLLYREDERELIPICKQMGVSLMPYSPLAAGHLTRPQWNTDTLRSQTDRVAMGKYDRTEEQDMQIVLRVQELAERYGVKMQQIALAWHWAKGVAAPIVGATKARYLDDAAGALAVTLTTEDIAYLEEPYLPHRVVGAIDRNPADGVMLLDEKK